MKNNKRSRLPRGLRWKSDSSYIWFSWRDSRGKQHQQSTETNDPITAFAYRAHFMERRKQDREEIKSPAAEMGKMPLKRVAELYFNWKTANSSAATVARECSAVEPLDLRFGPSWTNRTNKTKASSLRQFSVGVIAAYINNRFQNWRAHYRQVHNFLFARDSGTTTNMAARTASLSTIRKKGVKSGIPEKNSAYTFG